MASGVTNRGRKHFLGRIRGDAPSGSAYRLRLVTNAVTPAVDHNTFSEFTEIATGNGYTSGDGGGIAVPASAVGFDDLDEDDAGDLAELGLATVDIAASGGAIPPSGGGMAYALLTDANGTASASEVYAWFDLSGPRSVADGETLRLERTGAGEWCLRASTPA